MKAACALASGHFWPQVVAWSYQLLAHTQQRSHKFKAPFVPLTFLYSRLTAWKLGGRKRLHGFAMMPLGSCLRQKPCQRSSAAYSVRSCGSWSARILACHCYGSQTYALWPAAMSWVRTVLSESSVAKVEIVPCLRQSLKSSLHWYLFWKIPVWFPHASVMSSSSKNEIVHWLLLWQVVRHY